MSRPEDQIVFEDLHGVHEDKPVTVDLDADMKDSGIVSAPDDESVDSDLGNDDDIEFDNLRSAEDADQQGDEDDAASSDGEDDGYSKKVQARIKREQRAKNKERQRADYWEQQAKNLAKSAYEGEKRSYERTIEQAGSALEQTEADLERAIEEGNTKEQVRLTKRFGDLQAEKALAESRLNDLSPDGNLEPFDDKISPEGRKTRKSKSESWMDDRSDWYRRAGFERATRLANRLDKEIFNDGYDPNTDEYFAELDRRIKEKMPELYDDLDAGADDTDDQNDRDSRRGKSVVAPVGGNESRRQRSSGSKVELGEEDFANIRRFGLNPNDPEVLREYARNKREVEQRTRRR